MLKYSVLFASFFAIGIQALTHTPPIIRKQPPRDEILFKVVEQSYEYDKPFIIECEAECEPPARYRWNKNGKPFDFLNYDDRISQQPGRGTLVFTAPRDFDQGQYQCFAENEYGIAASNTVFVRKAELKPFKDDSTKIVTAEEGLPFKLECLPPESFPKPKINWLKISTQGFIRSIDNLRMTQDPEGNLWISEVTRDDNSSMDGKEFYYVCSAATAFLNEYKLGSRISLEIRPSGTVQEQNQHPPVQQYVTRTNEVALLGREFELFCIFGGTPVPQVLWMKNGSPINWNDRIISRNNGKSLFIKTVSFEDEGNYSCEASNGVGSLINYSMNLHIQNVPNFTTEPKYITAAEDETATFVCKANAIPEPEIKWTFNGKPIEDAPNNPRRTVTQNEISIRNLIKEDTGNYGCNASNSHGYVYKDVYLNILALPKEIVGPPQMEVTVVRSNVTLACKVFGSSEPYIKWFKNGLEITGGRFKVTEKGNLEIKEVHYQDAGEYQCYTENKFDSVRSNSSLVVKDATTIVVAPVDLEAAAGTRVIFRCQGLADSSLELQISWLQNDIEIDFESDSRFMKTDDNSLHILNTIELDSGIYKCLAKTELDSVFAEASLIVQDVPNPPEIIEIQCNAGDATISWRPQGDNRAPILYYTIEYNTAFTPNIWDVAIKDVPATDLRYSVGISPWGNYTFRVIASNKIGPSRPSSPSYVCTTRPAPPFKNPDNVEGHGTEPDNLVITWTPMPQIEHNGPQFYYRVSWQRETSNDIFHHQDVKNWTKSYLIIPDQPAFQKYRIKVTAQNELGEAIVSAKEVFGYSGEGKPTEAPLNFTLLHVMGADRAVFRWNPVPSASVRGHFRGYKIQTWSEAEGEQNLRENIIIPTLDRVFITQLTPASKNFAQIFVFNGRYNGPPSNIVSFITPEGTPGVIQKFEAYQLGPSALWLTWKPPTLKNGELAGYIIKYKKVNDDQYIQEVRIYDPLLTSSKLSGLNTNTKYRLEIQATTKAGAGEISFTEQNTLMHVVDGTPPSIPHFTWERYPSKSGSQTIKIQWRPTNDGRSGSNFYVAYRKQGENIWVRTELELIKDYKKIHNLDPFSIYEVKIIAVDGKYETESETQLIDTSIH